MNLRRTVFVACFVAFCAAPFARAAGDPYPAEAPAADPPGAKQPPPRDDPARAATRTEGTAATDARPRGDAPPKFHPFSLKRLPPDEEPWDPTWQMDPRIGRGQRWNAPN